MIDPLNKTNGAAQQAADPLTGAMGNQALGKDAFLKLLVAQIAHQDPLKPMDDTAFVAQLAQFSALEQQMSTNQLLEAVALQQRGLGNTADVALVGKNVTVKGSTVTISGQGTGTPVRFTLGGNATAVTVQIRDATGKVVRTMKLGAENAGLVTTAWDGRDDVGTAQPAGAYTVSVSATSQSGAPVSVSQETTGVVQALTFDQGVATLVLDNGVTAPTSDLERVNATSK